MDFLKIGLWKRLWIAWSKTLESFVKLMSKNSISGLRLYKCNGQTTTTLSARWQSEVPILKTLDKIPVGPLDDLLNGLELLYDLNWTEDLLTTDLHLISDVTINIMAWMEVLQNGWQEKECPGPEYTAGYDTTRLGTIPCDKVEDQKT